MREQRWHDIRGRGPLVQVYPAPVGAHACANRGGTTFADAVRAYLRPWISTHASPPPRGSLAAWTRLMRLSR